MLELTGECSTGGVKGRERVERSGGGGFMRTYESEAGSGVCISAFFSN